MENNEQIITAIEKLAEKLGVKAELIYSYYLKQAKMFKYIFLINISCSLFMVITAVILIHFFGLNFDEKHTELLILSCVLWCGLFISIISFFVYLFDGITNLFISIKNPEYMATEDLLTSLRNA